MFELHVTLTRQNILFLNKQQIVCYFRLIVFSQESVPLFGPPLPSPPEFYDPESFRDFLLVKRKLPRVVNILFIKKRFTCKYTTWVISCDLIKKNICISSAPIFFENHKSFRSSPKCLCLSNT